jgi:nonsense-mediated mRNA decay protein 3
VRVPGGWKKVTNSVSDSGEVTKQQIHTLLGQEVSTLNKKVEIDFEITRALDRVHYVTVRGIGRSHNDLPPHTEQYPVEIRFSYATCDSCGLMSGGYHEAVVQIRADGRQLSDDEAERVLSLVTNRTIAEYGCDARAFVTSIDRHHHGLDFKVGSEHLARKIGDEVEQAFLASRKENFKLITQEHGGKRKYRMTIMLRLPRFVVGDFIIVAGTPCVIRSIGQGVVSCRDLKSGTEIAVGPRSAKWQSIEFIAEAAQKRRYTVVTEGFQQPFQLMDAETYITFEVDRARFFFPVHIGDEITGVTLNGDFYVFPIEERV